MEQKSTSLLEIHNLSVSFDMYDKGLSQKKLKVISDLHLSVKPGEIVAIAGSSGSGKSLLASAILGILPDNASVSGHLHYRGEELTLKRQKELRGKEIALVPQSISYLDPLMKVAKQVNGDENKRNDIFNRLDLKKEVNDLYPFELSGGMARRVLVSTALLSNAQLIIADEPTPGMSLDQALKALKMFKELANEGKAVILITHDIDLAIEFADRIAVFYAGTTVETTLASNFKKGPDYLIHPYTKALWHALPQNDFKPIEGFQPYAGNLPKGCLFAPRCPFKDKRCIESLPPIIETKDGEVRCYHGFNS